MPSHVARMNFERQYFIQRLSATSSSSLGHLSRLFLVIPPPTSRLGVWHTRTTQLLTTLLTLQRMAPTKSSKVASGSAPASSSSKQVNPKRKFVGKGHKPNHENPQPYVPGVQKIKGLLRQTRRLLAKVCSLFGTGLCRSLHWDMFRTNLRQMLGKRRSERCVPWRRILLRQSGYERKRLCLRGITRSNSSVSSLGFRG